MARLGDVATYINGYAFKPDDWSDTGVPIIRIQDLTGNSYQTNRYNGTYDPKYEVNSGDVLISWSASLGVYIWEGETSVLNQHIFKVVFDKLPINKNYFVYQVEHILRKAQSEAHGATMKHLTKPVFVSLEFNLPSLDEQNRIAAILDKVTSLIALRKQQLAKLDELVKARFVEMFGDPVTNPMRWQEAKLLNHLDIISGYAFKSEDFREAGIPILRIGNINSGHFLPGNMVYWSDDPLLEHYKMYPGDLVMSLTGTVGKDDYGNVCVLGNEFPEYYLNQRNAKLLLKPSVNTYYLSELLKFTEIKRQLTGISRGVRQANISNKDILHLCVPIPPVELQQKFSNFVFKTKLQKLTIQKSSDILDTLKKIIMQKYFNQQNMEGINEL